MSTDTRERILKAAKELAEENESIQGVTISLEAVAQRAELTKPGLMYHFPTKESLMHGLVEQAAERWSGLLREHAGTEPDSLTAFDRYRAYISVSTTADVSRADYWIFSDALYHRSLAEAWQRHLDPWYATDGLPPSAVGLLTTARFCADGTWMSEATGMFPADDLAAVRTHALALIDQAELVERDS